MASPSNSRSLREPPVRQPVGHLAEQWLAAWLAPSQGVEPDVAGVEVDHGADQPVGPRRVHLEPPPQRLHGPPLTGPPQGDDPPAGVRLEFQNPALGGRPAGRRRLDPRRGPHPGGGDVSVRPAPQAVQRLVGEPGLGLRLPAAVEALDRRLEPRLPRRGEHRHDARVISDNYFSRPAIIRIPGP